MPGTVAISIAMKFLLVSSPTEASLKQAIADYSDIVMAVAGCSRYVDNRTGDQLTGLALEYDDVSRGIARSGRDF